jgi:hypothetical protein
VMMADVAAGILNSSAAYLRTAVNGAASGTAKLRGVGGGMGWPRARCDARPPPSPPLSSTHTL